MKKKQVSKKSKNMNFQPHQQQFSNIQPQQQQMASNPFMQQMPMQQMPMQQMPMQQMPMQQMPMQQMQMQQQFPMQILTPQEAILNDDEPIKEKSKQIIELTDEQKQQMKQIQNKISITIQSQYSKIQPSSYPQTMAGLITVKADEISEIQNDDMNNNNRPGIDIIFLLDKSGSMQGSKIELLKETLKYVLTLVNEQDRISLIEFDNYAQRINPLQRMTESNKNELKIKIDQMRASGGTNFYPPFERALNMIKNRKYKNQLTSIFMLSDGQASRSYETLFKEKDTIEDPFTIQTFGIGSDHDPDLMKDMAQLKQGNFYYIENMKIVDECFVDALGGIISIVAKNIKIKMNFENIGNQKAKIKEAYSIFWKKNSNNEYEISLNNLISGSSKDFVFLLEIPPIQNNDLEVIKIVEAKMEFTNIDETDNFTKTAVLSLEVPQTNDGQFNIESFLNKNVFVNFQRIQVAELMTKAADLAQKGENFQAQKELQKKIDDLQTIQFAKDNEIIQGLIIDLQEAHKRCAKQNFAHDGNIWMKQRNYMHMQQQGADFSMPQEQNIYSNKQQQMMQKKCKARKQ